MSDNTIDYLEGRVEDLEGRVEDLEGRRVRIAELEAEHKDRRRRVRIAALEAENMDRRRGVRIDELEAELETAHEIGAAYAKRVGEQAIELAALREALTITRGQWIHSANAELCLAALEGGGDG